MGDLSARTAQRHRKAAGQALPPGPPVVLDDAKRVLVMLDAPTRAIANTIALDAGSVSAGIRLALRYWQDHAK